MVGDSNPAIQINKRFVNVLLIEDNLAEARLLQELLKGTVLSRFMLLHAKRLAEAIGQLQQTETDTRFDVVLLDLTLPDSQGLDSLDSLIRAAPTLPIVVLTNTNDEDLAVEAVRHGAQDYLVKRHINQDILVRSLRYAIERKQSAELLREANEILEQRVQERTAELAAANEQLRQEILERQRVQERLEVSQQAGKIGTFEWNLQSDRITWTTELEALYGVEAGKFGDRQQIWMQTILSDDRDRVEQELKQAITPLAATDGEGFNSEFRILHSAGKVHWIAVKSSLFRDAAGLPLRLIGIHMDITEKKQLEAQFLRAQRLESLGTLASGIAHDLNNILTPILVVTQLLPLKLPDLNAHTRELLKTLEVSAQRGAGLVKQILSFTRGVEGKRVSLQISHLLIEIGKIVQQTLPKSIAIQTNIDSSLWAVYGDATQLHQVLMNLCVNARDAMPEGGILSITAENVVLDEQDVRAYLDAAIGAYVQVTIADTGTGISPDILHRIFDPFFTTKEVGKGTGLGLSAVLGIVKSHSGFVDVQSEIGRGSQFKIFLPASQSEIPADGDNLEPLLGQQELILVVDDEAAICQITKTMLEAYNYRVLTAQNGVEAIALFAEHKHEIRGVLMDLMMPAVDGLATVPVLRQFNPHVFVIAMSGLNSVEAVAQSEKHGFQTFLSKPFTTRELLQTLRQGMQ